MKKLFAIIILIVFGFLCVANAAVIDEKYKICKKAYLGEFKTGSFYLEGTEITKKIRKNLGQIPEDAYLIVHTRTDASGPDYLNKELAKHRAEVIRAEIKCTYPQILEDRIILEPAVYSEKDPVNMRGAWLTIVVPKGTNLTNDEIAGLINSLKSNFDSSAKSTNSKLEEIFKINIINLILGVLAIIFMVLLMALYFKNKDRKQNNVLDSINLDEKLEAFKDNIVTEISSEINDLPIQTKEEVVYGEFKGKTYKTYIIFEDEAWVSPFTTPSGNPITSSSKRRMKSETKRKFNIASNPADPNSKYYSEEILDLIKKGKIQEKI